MSALVAVLLAALAAPGTARATDGAVEGIFQKVDTDGDGAISKPEARALPYFDAAVFIVLDLDGDGRITRREIYEYRRQLEERGRLGTVSAQPASDGEAMVEAGTQPGARTAGD